MRILALANQKGGCGKTTVAVNLAAALAQVDKRVLVIDNDPQGHATQAYGFGERDFSLSTYDLYLTSDILVEDAFLEILPNLHLVPAGVDLSAVEQALAREPEKEFRLRRSLRRSALPYDYVLVDCPPSVGLLTFNALLASGEALVPVDPSYHSLQAVRKFGETLAVLRDKRSHDVISHLLMVNFDPRPRFSRALAGELEAQHGDDLLETVIHHTVRLQEAVGAGLPINRFDPNSRATLDFKRLARELVEQEVDVAVPQLARWTELLFGPQVGEQGMVRFVCDFPQAHEVGLSGSFNGWSAQGVALTRRDDGVWECHLQLPPGEHEYRFIVDGVWVEDPHNLEAIQNEFGGVNSLVAVP